MSFARIYSAQTHLLKGKIVTVEVDITPNTLHAFTLVGLPDKAVDESKDRMSSALKNSGFPSPKNQNQKIVISLSPADLKKEGPYFDLAIALAYLLSSGDIEFDPEGKVLVNFLLMVNSVRLKAPFHLSKKQNVPDSKKYFYRTKTKMKQVSSTVSLSMERVHLLKLLTIFVFLKQIKKVKSSHQKNRNLHRHLARTLRAEKKFMRLIFQIFADKRVPNVDS